MNKYVKPELEIHTFSEQHIVTTSGVTTENVALEQAKTRVYGIAGFNQTYVFEFTY